MKTVAEKELDNAMENTENESLEKEDMQEEVTSEEAAAGEEIPQVRLHHPP